MEERKTTMRCLIIGTSSWIPARSGVSSRTPPYHIQRRHQNSDQNSAHLEKCSLPACMRRSSNDMVKLGGRSRGWEIVANWSFHSQLSKEINT